MLRNNQRNTAAMVESRCRRQKQCGEADELKFVDPREKKTKAMGGDLKVTHSLSLFLSLSLSPSPWGLAPQKDQVSSLVFVFIWPAKRQRHSQENSSVKNEKPISCWRRICYGTSVPASLRTLTPVQCSLIASHKKENKPLKSRGKDAQRIQCPAAVYCIVIETVAQIGPCGLLISGERQRIHELLLALSFWKDNHLQFTLEGGSLKLGSAWH